MRRSALQLAAQLLRSTPTPQAVADAALGRACASFSGAGAPAAAFATRAAGPAWRHQATRGVRHMTFPPRLGGSWSSWGGNVDPSRAVWGLIAANGAVFLLWRTHPYFAQRHFTVSTDALRAGRVWTCLTSAFSQRDIGHLGGNMISLYFFGTSIARLFGGRTLLLLYAAGGIAGSLAHCGWSLYQDRKAGFVRRFPWLTPTSRGALGASAAVNAIVAADVLMFPTRTVLLYGFIPLPSALLGLLWLWNDVGGALGGAGPVAHAGHLGGAATGLAFFLAFKRGRIRPRGWW